ncbi:hypothetical protein [Streptomyces mirabilis]|uniref:hypothetical protein n=1 Tax=Streptomyces mirabilis TaxID=68239 RepID=UPI00332D988A
MTRRYIDGDALDRTVGSWLADRRTGADDRLHQWRSTARPCAERPGPRAARFIYSPPATTSADLAERARGH